MTPDPTLQTAIAAAAERAISAALRYDPASRQALARLEGQVLALELTAPSMTLFCLPTTEGLAVQSYYDGDITTRLRGSPTALLALLRADQVNLAGSGIEVFGSTALLIDLQRIARDLDIDWQAAISDLLGDVAGPSLANLLRGGADWLRQRQAGFERLLGEYLTEELRATPAKPELEHFYQAVDELRLQADRVAAKVDLLTRRIDASGVGAKPHLQD